MVDPTSLKLDDALKDRLEQLALARHRSVTWMMRQAISEYVSREEQRQAFQQDALHAWEAYAADGLHLTAHEADNWLARLEAGEDVDAPECHG